MSTEHCSKRHLVYAQISSNCRLAVGLIFEQVVMALVTDPATSPVVSSFASILRRLITAGFRLLSPAARFVPECNIVGSRLLLPSPTVGSIAVGLYITLHSLWTICVDRGSLLKALSRQFAVDPLVAVLDGLRVFDASNTLSRRPSVAPPLRLSMRLAVGFLVAH